MVPVSAAAAMAFPRKRHVQHFTNRFRGNALTCRRSRDDAIITGVKTGREGNRLGSVRIAP